MFEEYIITKHAIKRYKERIGEDDKFIVKRIKADLHFTKVKRIINEENVRHVFTRNSKEFIFTKDRDIWVLKTIIKRNKYQQKEAISKKQKYSNGGK